MQALSFPHKYMVKHVNNTMVHEKYLLLSCMILI